MVKVIYDGDDFKRMQRTDKLALERLVASGKSGIHEVAYKDTKFKVEIKKKGSDIIVKRFPGRVTRVEKLLLSRTYGQRG